MVVVKLSRLASGSRTFSTRSSNFNEIVDFYAIQFKSYTKYSYVSQAVFREHGVKRSLPINSTQTASILLPYKDFAVCYGISSI